MKAETQGRLWRSATYTSLSDLENMSQEGGEKEKKKGTVNMISRGARAERVRAAGAAQPRGRLAGIPGLAAHPSGRPAPRPLPGALARLPSSLQ